MIDLSDVLLGDDFAINDLILVERVSGGYGNDGLFVTNAPTTFILDEGLPHKPSIQQATPQDLLILPEGERTKEAINIYSVTRLLTAQSDQLNSLTNKSDIIKNYDGKDWKVMMCQNWGANKYYHSIAVRIK